MAKGFTIDLRGMEELTMTINNAHPKAVVQSVKVVKNNTEEAAKEAKGYAPYKTGFLHDNIVTAYEGMNGMVHSQASYAGYQEYGTRFITGTQYMRPALNKIMPQFQKDMTDVMRGAFK